MQHIQIPSAPAWVEFLEQTKVKDVIDPNHKLVTASFDSYVSELLKTMSNAKVLAAIVTDAAVPPGVLGFVDVMDILASALEATKESKEFTKENLQNQQWEGKVFANEKVGNIINKSNQNLYKTVDITASLMDVVKILAMEIHRVAVVDHNRVVNIISQSDIIRLITERGSYLGSKLVAPVKDVGLQPLGVCSVEENVLVVDVMKFMLEKKLSGVAVVDTHGRIITNFSATDLLGLTDENFPALNLPIKQYLMQIHGFPKAPVVCKTTETVEVVLLRMVVHKVHRVYEVDDSMKAIGVISMTDLMQFFMFG